MWLTIGAGIAAGAFLAVRAAVQLGSVAYALLERRLDRRRATRQSALLALGMIAALGVTALIAAYAVLALVAGIFEATGP